MIFDPKRPRFGPVSWLHAPCISSGFLGAESNTEERQWKYTTDGNLGEG